MATSGVQDAPIRLFAPAEHLSRLGRMLGAAVAVIGASGLVGHALDVPVLLSFAPGWTAMKAETAIGFLLAGAALAASTSPGWSLAGSVRLGLGMLVLLLGLATLLGHAVGAWLGVGDLLASDRDNGPNAATRPPIIAALNFALAGAGFLLMERGRGLRARPTEALSLAIGVPTVVGLVGYVFGQESIYSAPGLSQVALPTALGFVLLASGLFIARPTVGLMRGVADAGVGGVMLRRLLPAILILPVALGWIPVAASRAGYFDTVTGITFVVAAMAGALMVIAFVTIAPLAADDARRRAADEATTERIRRLNRVYAVLSHINHAIVRERDQAAMFERACRIAVDQGGFSAAWIGLAGTPMVIAADAGDADHRAELRGIAAHPAFAASGPATALAEGRVVIANGDGNALAGCRPLADLAARDGCRAIASFPLRAGGSVRGVLVLAASDPAMFDADEVRLLEELAMDVGFAMDVIRTEAERSRATAALRESQLHLERAVRAGNVGLWEWSLVSNQVYYSAQWKRQLGCDDDEIAGDFEAWRSRIHPEDVDRAIGAISDYLRGDTPHLEIEYRCRHRDGTYRAMLAHATVQLDERGRQVALLGAHVDVTQYAELHAQFLQAQKMESLGRLAGGIAHDFNNLLTIINGTADLALLRLAGTGERDEDWRGVRDAGERAATLTRQLLAISRKQVLQVEVLDPNEVLGSIEGLLRRLIGEDVVLRVSLSPDVSRVKADAGQLEQVVVNLAVNARDAMPRGGVLTIETRPAEVVGTMMAAERAPIGPGRYVVVTVSDTGEGMDETTQARAFEPFFTTKAPGKGTGLGLSTVFGIVRQSGGAIRLRSARGTGTTFEVYLPAVGEPARRARSGPHQAVVRGTETILVVEDEPALRMVARKILENAGYTVLVAASGDEALAQLHDATAPVHMVLTDVVMPGMSGPVLVGKLREEGARARVLFTSGYADDALTADGLREEHVHFLAKPYTGTTLLRKVREVLDARTGAAGA
jgi:signal transduction histidine kinase/CheY-like chemotaxis protein